MQPKKKAQDKSWTFFLVAPPRQRYAFCAYGTAPTGQLRCNPSSSHCYKQSKIKTRQQGRVHILVDSGRENWNCIFSGLIELNNRLEQLGIDAIYHESLNIDSCLPENPIQNVTTINTLAQGLGVTHV